MDPKVIQKFNNTPVSHLSHFAKKPIFKIRPRHLFLRHRIALRNPCGVLYSNVRDRLRQLLSFTKEKARQNGLLPHGGLQDSNQLGEPWSEGPSSF